MTNLAQWSALVGLLLPLLIAVVQQTHWSSPVRTIIGVLASVIASIVTPAVYSNLNWHTWATSFITVFGAALITYKAVWVPLGAAPWIEKSTSVKPPTN